MAASNSSSPIAQDKKDAKNNKQNDASPPKPYTKYTIYFRLEHMRLLLESDLIDDEIKSTLQPNHFDYIEHPRPLKYKDVQMPPFWYSSFVKPEHIENRKHCKKEGRISFKELSQKISASWRSIDDETAAYINKLAEFERVKYDKILEAFNKHQLAREKNSGEHGANTRNLDLFNRDSEKTNHTIVKRSSIPSSLSPEDMVQDGLSEHPTVNRMQQVDHEERVFLSLEPTIHYGLSRVGSTSSPIHRGSKRSFLFAHQSGIDQRSHRAKRQYVGRAFCPAGCFGTNGSFAEQEEFACDFPARLQSSFACVPEWHAEDAMRLLDILLSEPNAANDSIDEKAKYTFVCGLCNA